MRTSRGEIGYVEEKFVKEICDRIEDEKVVLKALEDAMREDE